MEVWKDIKDYEGIYQVSNRGNIRSLDREVVYSNGTVRNHKGVEMKPSIDKDGYLRVNLSRNGKKSRFFIHRLVGMAFIPNEEDKPAINHKDGVKDNNEVSNLEWATHSENVTHAFETGLNTPHDGGTSIPVNKVDKYTNKIIKKYTSISSASRDTGHSIQRIIANANTESGSYCDFVWRYEN